MSASDGTFLIFVYGTLKRGGTNHHFLATQRFVAEAGTAPGFVLYALDGYPGMIADVTARSGVTGEIWAVNSSALAALDDLEGIAEGLYRRVRVPLAPPHNTLQVEGYLYAQGVTDRPRIGSTWPV